MEYPLTAPVANVAVHRPRRLGDALGLGAMLLAVIAIIWLADTGMASIRDGLAAELFEQQRDIANLEFTVGRAESALHEAVRSGSGQESALAALGEVTVALGNMRRTYSFDSVEGASAAHALVYPALLDVQRWLTDGVPGYAPTDRMMWELAYRRTGETVADLRALSVGVTDRTRALLAEESAQVERLRTHLILAIMAAGLLSLFLLLATMRQRNAEERAARERGRLRDALNNIPLGVALFDRDDALVLANDQFATLFPGELHPLTPGKPFAALNAAIEHVRRAPGDDDAWTNEPLSARASTGPVLAASQDGRYVQLETRPTHEGGTVLVQTDVTVRRQMEQRLRYLATHDDLTELPGRRHFDTRLRQALNAAARAHRPVTLLCIDIDHFKQVNDEHGHPSGDAVLVEIARRLSHSVREHDIVARLSGDEFAVVMENSVNHDGTKITCARILADIAQPIRTSAGIVSQTVSIGVASYPEDATSADALVQAADDACYQAKRAGRNRVRFAGQPG